MLQGLLWSPNRGSIVLRRHSETMAIDDQMITTGNVRSKIVSTRLYPQNRRTRGEQIAFKISIFNENREFKSMMSSLLTKES